MTTDALYRGGDRSTPAIDSGLLDHIDSGPVSGASSRPPGGLSYEADIAPITRRFFHDVEGSSLSMEQKNAAVFGMADNVHKILDMRQKSESREQMMRLRDLQYSSTLESLKAARRKAAEEQRMFDALPAITEELDSILQSPMEGPMRKRMLSRWGVKNAGTLSRSPGARTAFKSAMDAADVDTVDPVSFAANVMRLGLDPASPEVAALPGASPLGIKIAVQSYEREQADLRSKATAKQLSETAKAKAATEKQILDGLNDIEFKEHDRNDGELHPGGIVKDDDGNVLYVVGDFKDASSAQAVEDVLMLANADEKAKVRTAITDKQKLKVAQEIRQRFLKDLAQVGDQPSATRSGFTNPAPTTR